MIVAIAIFTVVSRVAELGASTGLVRMISRDRAVGQPERITPTVLTACLPVLAVGVASAALLAWCAPALAELFGGGRQTAAITDQVRILAPFVPIGSLYTVLVQGSRGFGTMTVLVVVDKIARACALPVLAAVVLARGGGASAVVLTWGLTIAVATVVTIGCIAVLTRRATHGVTPPADGSHRRVVVSFWSFALPRAAGQSFDVAVLWLDTLLVAALIGPTAAGIYAAGTRFLLIGTFTAEAIQQAVAPRVSSLITLGQRDDARAVIQQATSWQAAITWPVYLVVIAFSSVLLGVFGPAYVQAQWALILLSIGLLVAVIGGPSDAVILMSGRSRQSLAELDGRVRREPLRQPAARQALRHRGRRRGVGRDPGRRRRAPCPAGPSLPRPHTLVTPSSRGRSSVAVATVGSACVASLAAFGATTAGLVTAVTLGGTAYVAVLWHERHSIHLQALLDSLRGASRRTLSEPRPILEHS